MAIIKNNNNSYNNNNNNKTSRSLQENQPVETGKMSRRGDSLLLFEPNACRLNQFDEMSQLGRLPVSHQDACSTNAEKRCLFLTSIERDCRRPRDRIYISA